MIYKFSEYITNEDIDILLEKKTPGQAAQHHSKREKTDNKVKNLINQLGYEYSFVFIFAPAVKGLYPIIEKLTMEMELPQELSKSSIVYLTICVLGILLNEPKEKYKDLINKLKSEKIYHLIKPLITSMKGLKEVFSFISNRIGKVITSFAEMFAYTALFVPFAMTFADIGQQSETTLTSILEAISNHGLGKLLMTSVGVGTFAVKHFMEDILNGLKTFKSKGISVIKKVIDKIKSINLSKLLPKMNKEEEVNIPSNVDYVNYINPDYIDNAFNESTVVKFSDFSEMS